MTRQLRLASAVLFVVTEALGWYLVLRVFASALERSTFTALAESIRTGLEGGAYQDQLAAAHALAVAQDAADGMVAGPQFFVVLAAAFGAFWLARGITAAKLGASGAVAGMIVSIVALNILLHIVLSGDLRLWNSAGFARFIDDPQSSFIGEIEVLPFVVAPDPSAVEGKSIGVVVVGLFALWLRFLVAGRRRLSFDRALRSFSFGFPFVLAAAAVAAIDGQSAGILALGYFILGVLSLAVANAARAADLGRPLTRAAPWVASLLATVGVLGVVAVIFGLLALLELHRAFTPVGELVLLTITSILVVVVTPLFWFVEFLLSFFGGSGRELPEGLFENLPGGEAGERDREARYGFPGWLGDAVRLALFSALLIGGYWLARLIFRRGRSGDDGEYDELRGVAADGGGMRGMLRGLMPSRSPRETYGDWQDRHAVYRLFGRVVGDSGERGFPRRQGETPLEFGALAGRTLDAEAFGDIAGAFDRARYGRHYPDEDEVASLERSLAAWEQEHPATEAWRREVAREEVREEVRVDPELATPAEDEPEMPERMGPI